MSNRDNLSFGSEIDNGMHLAFLSIRPSRAVVGSMNSSPVFVEMCSNLPMPRNRDAQVH